MRQFREWYRDTDISELVTAALGFGVFIFLIWAIYAWLDIPGRHPILFWLTFSLSSAGFGFWFYSVEANRAPKGDYSRTRRALKVIGTSVACCIFVFVISSILAAVVAAALGGDGAGAYEDCPPSVSSRYC